MSVVRIKAKCINDQSLDEIFILVCTIDDNKNLTGLEFFGYLRDYDEDCNGCYAIYPFILKKCGKDFFLNFGNSHGIPDEKCNINNKTIKTGELFTRTITLENESKEFTYKIESIYDMCLNIIID